MNPVLLIDTNYLCHRAFHAMEDLFYGDRGTGAVFGVLRDIVSLTEEFKTNRVVFAFDVGGGGHRRGILPTYKGTRAARHATDTPEDQEARKNFFEQVVLLRTRYLPAAGFRNVFSCAGFEADDIIAAIAAALPATDEGVIVSADQDLWQCMRANVWCWNLHTRRATTAEVFRERWGLEPHEWADVKAYAGCSTDDVPGVPGVGEATAARWLRGELGAHTQAFQKIRAARALYRRNLPLVRLPFPGTPQFEIQRDEVTEKSWQQLTEDLGMHSIRDTVPRGTKRSSRGRRRGQGEEGFGFDG